MAWKVESDGLRERGARSGSKQERLGGTGGRACGKLGKADSLRLREKAPTLSQRTRKNGAPRTRAKADSE